MRRLQDKFVTEPGDGLGNTRLVLALRARPNIRQRDIRERHIHIGSLFE